MFERSIVNATYFSHAQSQIQFGLQAFMPVVHSQIQFGQQALIAVPPPEENDLALNKSKKLDMNVLIEIASSKTSITKLALAVFDYAFEDEIKAGLFNDGSYKAV